MTFNKIACILFLLLCTGCSFSGVFFPADERPDDKIAGAVESIPLTASDGITIKHFMFKPLSKHKATIFVFHGSGSKVANWYKVIKPLINDGYQIFMMDYRGFGSSEGKANHLSIAQDANNALRYLSSRNDVKNKPLIILGQSYGGQLAINVAYRNPEIIDALITEGTFTSFSKEAAYSSPWIIRLLVKALFKEPYNSQELIANIDMLKLIIHSRDDKVVPINMAKTLYANARGDKELWEVDGEHAAALINMPSEYVSKINEVLQLIHSKP